MEVGEHGMSSTNLIRVKHLHDRDKPGILHLYMKPVNSCESHVAKLILDLASHLWISWTTNMTAGIKITTKTKISIWMSIKTRMRLFSYRDVLSKHHSKKGHHRTSLLLQPPQRLPIKDQTLSIQNSTFESRNGEWPGKG